MCGDVSEIHSVSSPAAPDQADSHSPRPPVTIRQHTHWAGVVGLMVGPTTVLPQGRPKDAQSRVPSGSGAHCAGGCATVPGRAHWEANCAQRGRRRRRWSAHSAKSCATGPSTASFLKAARAPVLRRLLPLDLLGWLGQFPVPTTSMAMFGSGLPGRCLGPWSGLWSGRPWPRPWALSPHRDRGRRLMVGGRVGVGGFSQVSKYTF